MAKLIIADQKKLEERGGSIVCSTIPDTEYNAETESYDLVEIPVRKLLLPNGMEFDIWDDDKLSIIFDRDYQSVNFQYLRSWLSTGYINHTFET